MEHPQNKILTSQTAIILKHALQLFLKDNFTCFQSNIQDVHNLSVIQYLFRTVPRLRAVWNGKDIEYCDEIINFAFTWSTTPEGHNFWYNLHRAWSQDYHLYINPLVTGQQELK